MTVKELKAQGYTVCGSSYQRGYISRRNFNPDAQQVHVAGGSRKGQYYYLAPCRHSTQYCLRWYFIKEA